MTRYENDEIVVQSLDDDVVIAGYKGDYMYRVHGGITEDDIVGDKHWKLGYPKDANIITNFKSKTGTWEGWWVGGVWYKNMGNGRFVSKDGGEIQMYEVMLHELDDDDEVIHSYFIGYTDYLGLPLPTLTFEDDEEDDEDDDDG